MALPALPFPSGERVDVTALPSVSSGRTGINGPVVQPALAKPLPPSGLRLVPEARLLLLADELGALVALEQDSGEPWLEYAALIERQTIGELARRAI